MLNLSKKQKYILMAILAVVVVSLVAFIIFKKPKSCSDKPQICWDGSKTYQKGPKCGYQPCPSRKKSTSVQTFTTTEDLKVTCKTNKDCKLPMEYAVKSNCPYEIACISNSCTVVCPTTIKVNKELIKRFNEFQENQNKNSTSTIK